LENEREIELLIEKSKALQLDWAILAQDITKFYLSLFPKDSIDLIFNVIFFKYQLTQNQSYSIIRKKLLTYKTRIEETRKSEVVAK
jgi:hypothetical protein